MNADLLSFSDLSLNRSFDLPKYPSTVLYSEGTVEVQYPLPSTVELQYPLNTVLQGNFTAHVQADTVHEVCN